MLNEQNFPTAMNGISTNTNSKRVPAMCSGNENDYHIFPQISSIFQTSNVLFQPCQKELQHEQK